MEIGSAEYWRKDREDRDKENRLRAAAANGDTKTIKALIAEGVFLDNGNSSGHTAVLYAVEGGHVDVLDALLKAGASPFYIVSTAQEITSPLIWAVWEKHLKVAQLLIDAMPDHALASELNVVDYTGHTALMRATHNNDIEMARLLVERGAHVAIGHKGLTPAALAFNKPQILEILRNSAAIRQGYLDQRAAAEQEQSIIDSVRLKKTILAPKPLQFKKMGHAL